MDNFNPDNNNRNSKGPDKQPQTVIIRIMPYLLIPILLLGSIFLFNNRNQKTESEYYQIISLFEENKVDSFELNLSSGTLTYQLRDQEKKEEYRVPSVELFVQDVHDLAKKNNVKFDYKAGSSGSWLLSMLPSVIMFVLMIGLMYFMFRRMGQSMMNDTNRTIGFGRINAKGRDEKHKTTFNEVAGCEEEKEELSEIVEFLKNYYLKIGHTIHEIIKYYKIVLTYWINYN